MSYRVAINGYGRIGQSVLRAIYERSLQHQLVVVAINELSDIDTVTYLTRYDTIHGKFPFSVEQIDGQLCIDGDQIQVLNVQAPSQLPWAELAIDLVLECTGSFNQREVAQQHLDAGAQKLLFSHPALADVDATIVYGYNHHQLNSQMSIVSAASCTTNCIIPVLDLLHRHYNIQAAVTTTIHSAMNDQPIADSYHKNDLRLTRGAMSSIVPVDTGLAKGIDRILPELAGLFQCLHIRVPTINVSMMDISLTLAEQVTVESVNDLLQLAAKTDYQGLVGFTNEPHASVDFNHDDRSCIVDATQTRVSRGHLLKLVCWFDNEWGFANRMLDVADHWLKAK
ncbi:MAG: erythrose-4-phosphate dehydrogenase [Pseudomonadales bacterium]|nr:erythrose-4-phosphate dehydrogenase [Pseudomonadales bacterium]NRA16014.1 erythrose-4-phosphate dehydrogenase [Oceanospirillaceae bacterium]